MKKITTKFFSLSCEDQPGLLARVLQQFTRPGYALHTVTQSRTDVSEIILVSLEVVIPGVMVDRLIRRLHRIVGVLDVTVSFGALLNDAVYRLLPSAFGPELCALLHGHQARILSQDELGHVLVHQVGREQDIRRLYECLDGPALVGFCQVPLAISQPLNWAELKSWETQLASIDREN